MREMTLINDFHGTYTVVRPRSAGGGPDTISRAVERRVWRALCGMPECQCSGYAGVRDDRTTVELETWSADDGKLKTFAIYQREG